MEKVTIITVCRNAGKTIRKTLESVLIQRYSPIEYILVDGASVDDTNTIIESYRDNFLDKGITYIHISEKDNGIYDAMNKGLIKATGEWVNFLNADDAYIDENVLGEVFGENYPGVDCIYGDSINVLKNKYFYRRSLNIGDVVWRSPYVHQALFCRTKVIQKDGFNTQFQYAADFDFAVRMYMQGKVFLHINIPICAFSLEGVSQKNTIQVLREFEKIRRTNGLGKKAVLRRYLLYIAVLFVKSNTNIYGLYVWWKRNSP